MQGMRFGDVAQIRRMMMSLLRFDGRTAIVTGAGRNPSLGRAFALLLASRGANVVVNDIGDTKVAAYKERASPEDIVEEIRSLGGSAIPHVGSVTEEAGVSSLVKLAKEAFGRIDILINNAGVCVRAPFDRMSPEDFRLQIDVNLMGAALASRAVWPHMREQQYGRIINVGSSGMYGMPMISAYGAGKGGLFALTRALATEGERVGINANSIHPTAFTQMMASLHDENSTLYKEAKAERPAELVAPVVAYLAHESCRINGECFGVGGGRVNRVYMVETEGIFDRSLTVEAFAARCEEVLSEEGGSVMGYGVSDPQFWEVKTDA